MGRKKSDSKKWEKAFGQYKTGKSLQEIANEYGCTYDWIRAKLYELGYGEEMAKIRTERYSIDAVKAFEMYKRGKTYAEIGEKYGCSASNIRNKLAAAGYAKKIKTLGNSRGKKPVNAAKAFELYSAGKTYAEIGKKYGCSASHIRNKLIKSGHIKKIVSSDRSPILPANIWELRVALERVRKICKYRITDIFLKEDIFSVIDDALGIYPTDKTETEKQEEAKSGNFRNPKE